MVYNARLFKTTLRRYGDAFYGDYSITRDGVELKIISEYSRVVNKIVNMLNKGEMKEDQI